VYVRALKQTEGLKETIAALVPPKDGALDALVAEVNELQVGIGEARSQLNTLSALATAMAANPHGAVCMLCDQTIDPSTDISTKLGRKQELWSSKNVAAEAELMLKSREWSALNAQTTEYTSRLSSSTLMLENAEKHMLVAKEEIGDSATEEQASQILQTIAGLRAARDHTVRISQQLEHTRNDLQSWVQHLNDTEARADAAIAGIQKSMAALGVSGPSNVHAVLGEATEAEQHEQEVQMEIGRVRGKQQQLEKGIARLKETIEDLKARKEKEEDYVKALTTLRNARDWFHHSHGPKILISKLLNEITRGVNDFLERFGSTFGVVADPDSMSFRYYYHDARPMPDEFPLASELSGGEKIILAVSFRFASYCLFAGRVGLLSLDEPTVYLDDRNVGKFCQMMERVKEVATAMDLQIFLSTHERSVMPYADTLIDLGENTTV